ncbi:hypothetical protein [Lacihabitans lacunae]|uniref:Uncharacterized protein n=1 Tax=Lacihabitans lacunae TaxID=1028214 RepID=A0ABV7YWN5_9BACT
MLKRNSVNKNKIDHRYKNNKNLNDMRHALLTLLCLWPILAAAQQVEN